MTFLNDRTKLIANPGLRATVRSDVSALTQLVAYWKAQLGHSPLGQFLVRSSISFTFLSPSLLVFFRPEIDVSLRIAGRPSSFLTYFLRSFILEVMLAHNTWLIW